MSLPARAHALFISDLHLQAAQPAIAKAFFAFLQSRASAARELYLLGDIFEYWAGDDDLDDPFNLQVVRALRAVADSGTRVFWLGGNRDFLVGAGFADEAGCTLLEEPHMIEVGGVRIALVHGDAQCTDDLGYMQFRAQVRDPAWQKAFLAKPLDQRKAIIAGLREGSKAAHKAKRYEITDVNHDAVEALFAATGADVIIHGHTHRPALHRHGNRRRYVLPDWELATDPPRGGWISVDEQGHINRYDVDGAELHFPA